MGVFPPTPPSIWFSEYVLPESLPALVRLLEIIGEAAAGVSADARAKSPGIPWSEIVGLRNRLIHGYDAVDLGVIWSIIERDLPALVRELESEGDR